MGKGLLFRWEESEALKHHCGFCDRPLHHPGARSSCFGTHAEPCFRYHQAMFMRNRGHTCDICIHIDEHHYKRHHHMCEQLRGIYENYGEEWPIIPEVEDDRGRSRTRDSGQPEGNGRSSTSGDTPLKKKDKKEMKRQIRAASRTKVITQEEIKYLDSILHSAATQEETENPKNHEEIEEIEQHLKYNAQCYNDGAKRHDIREFAHIADADIDFAAEIDRIFDVLRITELVKRNEKNRGLRNKELAIFTALVAKLKGDIIEDLVLAKKDELEIRMRRAAFLRYTNRAAYDIVTNRYVDRDWKTGEKHRLDCSESVSTGSLTAVEEEEEPVEEQLRSMSSATLHDADRRHIEQPHKRLGTDGLLQEVEAIKVSEAPKECTPKPLHSLRIVDTNVPPSQIKFRDPWKQNKSTPTTPIAALKRSAEALSFAELPNKCSKQDPDDSEHGWQTVGATTSPSSPSFARNGTRLSPREVMSPTQAKGVSKIDKLRNSMGSSSRCLASDTARSLLDYQTSSVSRASTEPAPSATPEAPWAHIALTRGSSLKPIRIGVIASMYQDPADRWKVAEKAERDTEQAGLDAEARLQERKERVELAEAQFQQQLEEKAAQKLQKPSEATEPKEPEQAPVESRKKKDKKKQREAERKARRAAEKTSVEPEQVDALDDITKVGSPSKLLTSSEAFGKRLEEFRQDLASPSNDSAANTVSKELEMNDSLPELTAEDDLLFEDVEELGGHDTVVPENALAAENEEVAGSVMTSTAIPTTKLGRHKDWVKFLEYTAKVDSLSKLTFLPNHPAYKDHTGCLYLGNCPWEDSGILDCPHHRSYCSCIDPLDPLNDQCIVYPDAEPCRIGPYNCMQSEKLMNFFNSQPKTEGRAMLVDESLYRWLCTDGKHFRVETMTLKKFEPKTMPKYLVKEVFDYIKGYSKGRLLKQVEQYQALASKNEALRSRTCQPKVTEELLKTMRKKCESGLGKEAICYCMDNQPRDPDNDDALVQCNYVLCLVRYFHRDCVEALGYNKVTTWYCGYCERYMNLEAQRALLTAHSMHKGIPAPDFATDEDTAMSVKAMATQVDSYTVGHCSGH